MLSRILSVAFMLMLLALCVPGNSGCTAAQDQPDPGPLPAVRLVNAYPGLTFDLPLWLGHDGTGNGKVYVVEQDGKIYRFDNEEGVKDKELWFDISDRIPDRKHNEEGLLALAFHPEYADNGWFYVHYSQHRGGGKPRRGVTSRFHFDEDDGVDMASESIIMEIEQRWGNHNGCTLLFGDDGYLYSSFGDGGSANDPLGSGQDLSTLLGTVLRIDVDNADAGRLYGIPEDNPFADREDARGEIWAYGLRNVWRMSFDRKTGHLWGGDVGQNAYEEIDLIVKGGNYGWNKREGKHSFQGGKKEPGMIDPVVDYPHRKGISVTGGYVYRGKAQPGLEGVYVYADYGSGRIWGLTYDYENEKLLRHELMGHFSSATISSFGEDAQGELYACAHRRSVIYRVVVDEPDDEKE